MFRLGAGRVREGIPLCGAIFWTTGHFTEPRRRDVLVTVRRSIMHSDESYLLSGADGDVIWHKAGQISGRGTGGQPFAVADFDGDGLDDAASLYPSIVYILEGATGENLLNMDATWPPVPLKPAYWGIPIVVDGETGAGPQIFFASGRDNSSLTALVRPNGELAWFDSPEKGGSGYPAFGDFIGDGRTKAICWGYENGMHCYDVNSGLIEWRLDQPVPGNPTGSASADLNGDGIGPEWRRNNATHHIH